MDCLSPVQVACNRAPRIIRVISAPAWKAVTGEGVRGHWALVVGDARDQRPVTYSAANTWRRLGLGAVERDSGGLPGGALGVGGDAGQRLGGQVGVIRVLGGGGLDHAELQ